MSGGASPKRKGDAFEAAVCKDLERHGFWAARLRQGGGQPVDIIAVQAPIGAPIFGSAIIWCVQCKVTTPYMRPEEREQFVMSAHSIGARAMLSWKQDGAIQYKELT